MFIIILMFTIRKLDEVPKTIALILLDPESRCQGRNHRRAYSCSILPITVYGNCWCSHIALLVFFFAFYFFLIGGQVLYNIVLASATHQHELATGIHMSSPSLFLQLSVFQSFSSSHI